MGQYFTLVNYDKKEEVSVSNVGSGFIKMQELVANDDFGRLLAFIMADGNIDGGAVRSSWAGDEIQLIGDYRKGAQGLPKLKHVDPWHAKGEEKFKDVTRQMVEEFNAYASWYGQPLVRYTPPVDSGDRYVKGKGYYPVGRVVVKDYGPDDEQKQKTRVISDSSKRTRSEYIYGVLPAEPGTPLKLIDMPCEEFLCPGCATKKQNTGFGIGRPDMILVGKG